MDIIFSEDDVKELEILSLDDLIDSINEIDELLKFNEIIIPKDLYFE